MGKEVFAKRWELSDFLKPLIALPFGFWGIYWFENGFDWIVAVLGIVLFFIVLPAIIVFWGKK